MLVLSRTSGQCVVINGNIKVTVVDVKGDRVRLGFEAPSDVRINREEVESKILEQKGVSSLPRHDMPDGLKRCPNDQ